MTEAKYRWNRNAASHREAIGQFVKSGIAIGLPPPALITAFAWAHGEDWSLVVVAPIILYMVIVALVFFSQVYWYARLNEMAYKKEPPPPRPAKRPALIYDDGTVAEWSKEERGL